MSSDMAFQTMGRACYQVEAVDTEHAASVGCPDATHRVVGSTGVIYGSFTATGRDPGSEVKVPGWPSRKGVRALFVPAVLDESGPMPFEGYLGLS